MRKRHQQYSPTGSNIRTVTVSPDALLTEKQRNEREWNQLIADELYAQAAPLRAQQAAEAAFRQEVALTENPLSAYWNQGLDVMWPHKAIADSIVLGGYEMREESEPVTDGRYSFMGFTDELEEHHITVTPEEMERLKRFMNINVGRAGISTCIANWWRAFARLYHLSSAFRAGVTGYTEPVLEKPQPLIQKPGLPQKQLDPMETAPSAEAKRIADTGWAHEVRKIFGEWIETDMVGRWGVSRDLLTSEEMLDYIQNVLERSGRSPFRADTWDHVRRVLDYQGKLGRPRGATLTQDEKIAASLEDTTLSTAEFSVRQDIIRRLDGLR